jgi:hypothetical protein
LIELTLIILTILLGPIQGGIIPVHGTKAAARILIGVLFAYALFQIHWFALVLAKQYFIDMSHGVGRPEGAIIDDRTAVEEIKYELEKYEWEWLRYHNYISLAVRGFIFVNPVHIIANPLGMWIAKITPSFEWFGYNFGVGRKHEALHFGLAMLMVVICINTF